MLLEVLVAILIFAIGVLSLVGLQAASIKQSSAAKYRADATMLADDLIGRMWVSDRTAATLAANFATAGPSYNLWLPSVQSTLPGAAANPPTVTITPVAGGAVAGGPPATSSSLVTITLQWKAPNEPTADPAHSLTVVARIK